MAPTQCPTLIRVRLDMQAERQWYLSREGEQYGPFSDGEVTTFHQAKKLLPTDHFWCEGFRDWQPLSALFAPQQPAAQQWQLETTQRNVVQRSPQASIAHQREEVVPQQVDEPEKTPLAVWGWLVLQVSVALPAAMLLGAAVAYAYQFFAD
jgi:uncharacterized protein DUF4339